LAKGGASAPLAPSLVVPLLATDRYHFFATNTDVGSQISADKSASQYYLASLILVKFEFAYPPVFKRSNIGR